MVPMVPLLLVAPFGEAELSGPTGADFDASFDMFSICG